ncbi:uroporphyrinogen decarboxylase family protein [bacterium]|nr:uroporphyrinogen decarboxylase family protein [bacterium]
MNSKERVRAVMKGEIPDKVPWGEFAVDFDTVGKIIGHETYYRAKAKSQMAFWNGRRDEVVQSWKEDGIEFYKKMDCFDIINVSAMASGIAPPKGFTCEKPAKIDDNTWEYRDGTVIKYSDLTADLTVVYDPHVGEKRHTPADFAHEPVVEPLDESCFEVVDALIGKFGGSRYMIGPCGHEVGIVLLDGDFDQGGGGFAYSLMEYYDHPETIRAAYRYEVALNNMKDYQYIRPGQDGVFFGHQDFASTQGPFISPEMFREFALPAVKERVNNIHENFHLPVFKHACGNNNKLLDMFVEAGYDAYQSIQRTAGMDLRAIKERYSEKLVPWGGLDVEILVSGTPEDIRQGVTRAMKQFKPGGRYIFGSSHSIAVGTKYDNFMTMIDEFEQQRTY